MSALLAGADAKVILVPAWSVVNPVVLAISVPATSTFTFLGSNPNILLLLSRPENTVVLPSPVKLWTLFKSVAFYNCIADDSAEIIPSAPPPSVPVLTKTKWSSGL